MHPILAISFQSRIDFSISSKMMRRTVCAEVHFWFAAPCPPQEEGAFWIRPDLGTDPKSNEALGQEDKHNAGTCINLRCPSVRLPVAVPACGAIASPTPLSKNSMRANSWKGGAHTHHFPSENSASSHPSPFTFVIGQNEQCEFECGV